MLLPAREQGARTLHDVTAEASFLARRRTGPRPETTPTNPHTQLTQNAPADLQERVFGLAASLPGVVDGPSLVSVPGARAFHLPGSSSDAREAFMVEREFAHLHPRSDGSLHMALPPDVVDAVIENGWAERHPLAGRHGLPANIVMVYGPRNEDELTVVEDLLRASHALANG
jgi:phospholipase/carboxylesterase